MQGKRALLTVGAIVAISILGAGCRGKDPEIVKREYVRSGDSYVARKQLREAALEYRNAIQQDPRFGEARLKLADTYAQLGEPANALREYVRAADLLPDNLDAQLNAANALLGAGQFQDAQSRAELILKKNPRHTEARLVQATALVGLSKVDDAVKEVETAIKNRPSEALSYAALGSLRGRRGDRAAAETAYQKAVELDPKSAPAHMALANFYWSSERPADAEREFKAALQITPDDLLANRALASFYLSSNRAPEAEPLLKNAAEHGPAVGQQILADYYFLMRRPAEGRALLDSMIKSDDPATFAAAKLRMAALREGDRDIAGALQQVGEVLDRQPTNTEALTMKASLQLQLNRVEEALTTAKVAQQAAPEVPATHFMLGRVLRAHGDVTGAIAAFSQVLQLNPQATDAAIELGQLQLQ